MPIDQPATAAASSAPDPQRRDRVLAARRQHWERARRLILVLLGMWLATTFGTVFFARDLAHLAVFGWPLSFYLAAQGASLIYLVIIGAYAWYMRRLDREFVRLLGSEA